MGFQNETVDRAWGRQEGKCAKCCKALVKANPGREGTGAWQSHHRKPSSRGGTDELINCVIFCTTGANCHFNVGHGGNWLNYAPLDDKDLPCLRIGEIHLWEKRPPKRPYDPTR